MLTDSNSANGTLVNGVRVTSHSLRHGDRIRFGDATFVFVPVADPLATITEVEEEESVGAGGSILLVREREILALVGAGRTDKEIAEDLFISVATVRSHLDRIRDKTGARRRPELTRLAMELDGAEPTARVLVPGCGSFGPGRHPGWSSLPLVVRGAPHSHC